MSETYKEGIPVDKYTEDAMRTNGDFMVALGLVADLRKLQELIHDWAHIDDNGEPGVFEVVIGEGKMKARRFNEEEIKDAIGVFITDPITDVSQVEQEVRNFIEHTQIADAVIRIITEGLNEEKT